jgi:GxxExxY protein
MHSNHKYSEVTDIIINCFYKVYNRLGYGFLEKVYEKALSIELERSCLNCRCQCPIEIFYEGENVGLYIADMIINNCIIVEIKAATTLSPEHEAQLINYLRATEIEVGLLLNFGKMPSFKRKVFTTSYKK